MKANRGSDEAGQAIASTVVEKYDRQSFAMVCGRCSLTLVKAGGVVYGARRCPKVCAGEVSVAELG